MMREEAKASTDGKEALSLTMPFDEAHVLRANASFLCAAVPGIKAVHVWTGGNTDLPEPDLLASAAPGKPQPSFFFDETIRPTPPAAPPSRRRRVRADADRVRQQAQPRAAAQHRHQRGVARAARRAGGVALGVAHEAKEVRRGTQ